MPLNITETVIENDTVRVYENDLGTVIIEGKINGNQVELDDDVSMSDVAVHVAAGDNPHTTTLEQARAADNQLLGPVDLDDDLVDDTTTIWNSTGGYVEQTALENDSVRVNGGNGVTNGGSVPLGDSVTLDVEPADVAGTLLSDDGSDNLAVDESRINHDNIDQSTVGGDDHHAEDHGSRHGVGGADELATALRYEPESEPATPTSGVVRWYDQAADAFRVKFDDGATATLAEK
jgi:hypothetical protein